MLPPVMTDTLEGVELECLCCVMAKFYAADVSDPHEAKAPWGVAHKQQPTWDDLRVFAEIAATGSIRSAARGLQLNPSTVSRRLAALEEALNVRLFERHPEGLKLTVAGLEAQGLAAQMGGQMQAFQRRLAGKEQRLAGSVRVTTAEATASLVSEGLARCVRLHGELHIELVVSDQMADLDRHESEVALRMADSPSEHLVGRRLGTAAVALYAARSYLERRSGSVPLTQHDWVEWPDYVRHKKAFRWLDEHYPRRHVVLKANSSGAVRSAVQAGVGVAPLSCVQAEADPWLVRLQHLPEDCGTPVWLVTHPDMRSAPRVRAVMDCIAEQLQVRRAWLEGR